MTVLRERRTLDLQRAVLERRLLLEAADKRRLEVVQTRFVSLAEPHLLALDMKVTPLGRSGSVEVRSGINAGVRNVDADRAWDSFREALDADLDDTQHATTRAGIHSGAMAGTIDVIQRSFAEVRLSGDTMVFAPNLPMGLRAVAFEVRYRGYRLKVELRDGRMYIASAPGDADPITVRVHGRDTHLPAGQARSFPLPAQAQGSAAS